MLLSLKGGGGQTRSKFNRAGLSLQELTRQTLTTPGRDDERLAVFLVRHWTLLLHKTNRSRGAYFSQEEQFVFMESCEGTLNENTGKTNTAAARKKKKKVLMV